jgi:signal transduction histidine kinase
MSPWHSYLTNLVLHPRARWTALSLAGQFAVAALVVLGCGMAVFGLWVSSRIERGVLHNTAAGVSTYINSFVERHVQELTKASVLKPESVRALDALLKDTALARKVVGFKIWATDGTIVYSNRKEMIGRKLPMSDRLRSAVRGEISAEFNTLDDDNKLGQATGVPVFEIYSPITATASDRIIAVAEFYEEAGQLQAELGKARLQSWYIVALVTLAMLSILFGIVRNGSQTIAAQERALRDRIDELSALLAQNKNLHQRIDEIHRRSVETNDLVLRRIGSELHDGPAQLISLALLRLDALRPKSKTDARDVPMDDFERIRGALVDSLAEIRNMSAGVALPELEKVTPAEALALAARTHERRTGTTVSCEFDGLPPRLSNALKACLYRFAQEALNNAFRHGGGQGQSVRGTYLENVLQVEVSDAGPGFEPDNDKRRGERRLGLTGMRDRVASLGGSLEIESQPGHGTRLTARFNVSDDGTIQ